MLIKEVGIMWFLWYFIGLAIGGFIGYCAGAILSANKINKENKNE